MLKGKCIQFINCEKLPNSLPATISMRSAIIQFNQTFVYMLWCAFKTYMNWRSIQQCDQNIVTTRKYNKQCYTFYFIIVFYRTVFFNKRYKKELLFIRGPTPVIVVISTFNFIVAFLYFFLLFSLILYSQRYKLIACVKLAHINTNE